MYNILIVIIMTFFVPAEMERGFVGDILRNSRATSSMTYGAPAYTDSGMIGKIGRYARNVAGALGIVYAIGAAACGDSRSPTTPSNLPVSQTPVDQNPTSPNPNPSGPRASVSITRPSFGQMVSSPVDVGYTFNDPTNSATHLHFYLDNGLRLEDMILGDMSYRIENISAGNHSIRTNLATADHSEIASSPAINFDISPPVQTGVTVRGSASPTFLGNFIDNYLAEFGLGAPAQSEGSMYSANTKSGSQTATFTGLSIKIPRIIAGVPVTDEMTLNFDAIPANYPFDINNYRTMALGINVSTGPGINQKGRSARLPEGMQPHIYVVKNSRVSQSYYDTIRGSLKYCGQLTRGRLGSPLMEFVDSEPSSLPIGSGLILFEDRGSMVTSTDTQGGDIIIKSVTRLPINVTVNNDFLPIALGHEICGHGIALDHSDDPRSIMYRSGPSDWTTPVTQNDADAGFLKYSRSTGHTLDVNEDKDTHSAATISGLLSAPPGLEPKEIVVCEMPIPKSK